MTRKHRMLTWVLGVFCMLLFVPAVQLNAAKATGTVKNKVVNVRESSTTSSKIVCKLSKGTTVTIDSEKTGTDNKKWYEIQCTYNGGTKKGYIRSDLLNVSGTVSNTTTTPTTTTPTVTASPTSTAETSADEVRYVNKSSVRVREHAAIGSKILGTLEKGVEVKQKSTKTGDDGNKWSKISFYKDGEKLYGYVRSDLLTSLPPSGTTVDAGDEDTVMYVSASAVRVREHASDSSTVIANLMRGDKVKKKSTKTGTDGKEWTKVSFIISGTKYHGYIRSDYLSAAASSSGGSASLGDTLYVTAAAVRVRDSASDTAGIVANLLQGDKVKVKSSKKGSDGREWTKVSFEINGTSYTGYIRSDLLSSQKTQSSTSSSSTSSSSSDSEVRYVKGSTVRLRESASSSSAILTTLNNGQMVKEKSKKTGTDGREWTKVSYTAPNGTKIYGYIRSDLLK